MSPRISIFLTVGALLVMGCAQSTASRSSNAPQANVEVQFTDMTVQPKVAEVAEGGVVVWTNMATNYNAVVSFPISIKDSFTCSELRPLFSETAGHLTSVPIKIDSEDVTLPCPLKPGEYDYNLNLFNQEAFEPGVNMEDPDRVLPAKIIVK